MADFFRPEWPAPNTVRALQTLRSGGVSRVPWDSFNLAGHVGDNPADVVLNRELLRRQLPAEPCWLSQVHGNVAVNAPSAQENSMADAAFSRQPGVVCAVMTADCLPVLFCDRAGSVVAAAHAGWRGLLSGVLEQTVVGMRVPGEQLLAWLGPAIGPENFEVGDEVRQAFVASDAAATLAFKPHAQGKWLANLELLARQRLNSMGVGAIFGGGMCTVDDHSRFYSYRRDGITGRMASLIWLA
ncbi:peptidoglycan editing factor PgeF [Azonexus sp.]|uniref:peptidoglycan editing factor PgeF n=1 Tax=Azonexus sp. TaxID=1872668 RepID=UPI0027BAD1B6|nr:peptidoglycan editing factor PgeF [Azonexus sp.]